MVAIVRVGALLGVFFLGSCSQNLNMSRVEATIQNDIERQGRRLSLKSVICPNRVQKQAEAYFRCVGQLPDGGEFTINVIQQDDQGTLSWDVPSSKVLINLAALEETIQDETQAAVGKRLAIDCRDTYRVSKRGDAFECDVVGPGTVAAGRVESVLVRVTGTGDLEWQEVVIGNVPGAGVAGAAGTPTPGAGQSGAIQASDPNVSDATAESGSPDGSPSGSPSGPDATVGLGAEEEEEEDGGDRQ